MNFTQKIGLSLLLVALGAPSAFAALSGNAGSDAGGNGAGIEVSGDDTPAQRRFDQTLAVKVLDETVLQRHARSALPASAPMEGHYGRDGAQAPELFGRQDLSQFVSHNVAPEVAGDSAGLVQMAAVHMVGSGSVTGEAPVASPGVTTAATQYVATTSTGSQNSIPLPPALLLMASGLFFFPTIRHRINRTC